MSDDFRFEVDDLFHFRDGRTVFAGVFDREPKSIVRLGRFEIWVDDQMVGVVVVEGEMIASGGEPGPSRSRTRSLSTTEPFRLDRGEIAGRRLTLRPVTDPSKGRTPMHRHLLGIDSPPAEFVPDTMTLGPVLPEGWDGDAWVNAGGKGHFLRAWNKGSGRIAIGQADTYEEARRRLMGDISAGTRSVSISFQEAQPA